MKYLVLGVLATVGSTASLADPQSASTTPSAPAARTFDCGPDLNANLVLRAATPSEATEVVYNGVARMQVNGRAADPMTLRFVNEKIAARTIDALAENCRKDAMDLVFSTSHNGAEMDMLTVTVQGSKVTVR